LGNNIEGENERDKNRTMLKKPLRQEAIELDFWREKTAKI